MQKISPVSWLWPSVESWSFFDRSVWCSCLLKQRTQAYPEKLLGVYLALLSSAEPQPSVHRSWNWTDCYAYTPEVIPAFFSLVLPFGTPETSLFVEILPGVILLLVQLCLLGFFFFLINLMIHVLSQKRLAGSLCSVRLSCVMVRYRFLQWAFPCLLPPCSFMGLPLCQPVSFLSSPLPPVADFRYSEFLSTVWHTLLVEALLLRRIGRLFQRLYPQVYCTGRVKSLYCFVSVHLYLVNC